LRTLLTLLRPDRQRVVGLVSLEERAAEVIEHQRLYWSKLTANLVASLSVAFFAAVLPYLALEVAGALSVARGGEYEWAGIELSGPSALAAFAVLATLIVALQVSVRAPLPNEDIPAAAARQIALESLARLCGAAAIAVGFAAAFTYLPLSTSVDVMRFIGSIAGAFLLAFFAGDAASASSTRLGDAMAEERKRAHTARLTAAVVELDTQSDQLALRGYALQFVVVVVVVPVATVVSYFLLWDDPRVNAGFVALAAAFFATVELIAVGLLIAARSQWIRGERLWACYWMGVFVLCGCLIGVLAFTFQPGGWPSDARSVIGRAVVTLAVLTIWIGTCVSVITHEPFSRRRGVGSVLLRWGLQRSIDSAARATPSRLGARTSALYALCILVPPLGLIWAHRRSKLRIAGHSGRSVGALFSGYGALAVWGTIVTAIFVANPPLS
jgi:hypothetical protein